MRLFLDFHIEPRVLRGALLPTAASQALVEGVTLLTTDEQLASYGDPVRKV